MTMTDICISLWLLGPKRLWFSICKENGLWLKGAEGELQIQIIFFTLTPVPLSSFLHHWYLIFTNNLYQSNFSRRSLFPTLRTVRGEGLTSSTPGSPPLTYSEKLEYVSSIVIITELRKVKWKKCTISSPNLNI